MMSQAIPLICANNDVCGSIRHRIETAIPPQDTNLKVTSGTAMRYILTYTPEDAPRFKTYYFVDSESMAAQLPSCPFAHQQRVHRFSPGHQLPCPFLAIMSHDHILPLLNSRSLELVSSQQSSPVPPIWVPSECFRLFGGSAHYVRGRHMD